MLREQTHSFDSEDNGMHSKVLYATLALAATLTACGGGSGAGVATSPPVNPGGGTTLSPQQQSENAIDTANSLGDPVKTLSNYNNTIAPSLASKNGSYERDTSGTCTGSVEFFAPDKNADASSTETQYFYDAACTQLARDVVRIYTINGNAETVNRTEKLYAVNNNTPSATRTSAVTFGNATFTQYGYPVVADGFNRQSQSNLDLAGAKTAVDDDELVVMPAAGNTSTFCGDAAGYNATGIQRLGETFGWQSAVATGGTRTINADGSVTWTATHTGSAFKGAIGSLSVGIANANTVCPIAAPEFALDGGTGRGQYSIPVTTTFNRGVLTNLTVTNATLANGNTLNVSTNSSVSPTSDQFVTGIVSNGGAQIATFNVDAFGDGTLTVTPSGAQYVMTDWHVIK